MKNFRQLVKIFFIILFLFVIFYLALRHEYLTALFNLPVWFIPLIVFIIILYIGYSYIELYSNKNQIEHEFTTIVNHTFRTPLTRINWISKELEKDLSQNERLTYLQSLNNATSRLIEIVDLIAGIKNIDDKTGYIFQATSLRDIVEKSIVKYREEINKKSLTFQVPTFKDIPMLTADLKKISFVVDSIIENAIIYTPANGQIFIDCIFNKNKLILSVRDDGPGLSFHDKIRIFSRFFRAKNAVLSHPDGMGIRLNLSRQIIARHHGKIYAKSKGRNKGTTFFIELPFHR
ncbi:MAG: HAMP domain-containing sensor histidine kinase [Patescibacteria group bacterium]